MTDSTGIQKVVTRFAPSPTGFLHIGSVRTAIYAYLFAKKHNGTFILRIEDTDKEREVAGSVEHIQESLKWLGVNWDYGPDKESPFGSLIQSHRLDSYKKYAKQLIEKGLAYPDPYSKEEIDAFRKKAEEEKRPFLYRDHRPETFEAWDEKKPLRLKVPEVKRYTWTDEVRGELTAGEEAVDDIILIKGDGYPTYNFAHIIDDLEMGVTHVMRGEEFISSTPKYLSIYDALGISYPKFATLPPILNDERTKKLSKRDGSKDILDYRAEGYFPETLFNFLALIGWNPGTEQEKFSKEELIQAFDIHRIQKAGGAFNEEKLDWLNKEYIKATPSDVFWNAVESHIPEWVKQADPQKYILKKLESLIRDRIHVYKQVEHLFDPSGLEDFSFFFKEPTYDPALLICSDKMKKGAMIDNPTVKSFLEGMRSEIAQLSDAELGDYEMIKAKLMLYADKLHRGGVLWATRVALSGKEKSPDPFTLIHILGKDQSMKRLDDAITKLL